MGYDASCTIRVDGQTARGTAWLEHKDLLFRGPFRLAIPLNEISSATAHDGCLRVRFGKRVAELEIGQVAEKWAKRITSPPSRLDKLGVKPGMHVILVAVQDPVFEAELSARGATIVKRATAGSEADMVFFAIDRVQSLERLTSLSAAMKEDGALWVLRPKGKSGVSESDTMSAGKRAGLVDVKVASFSETLSAEKYVIPVAKRRTRTGRPAPSRARG